MSETVPDFEVTPQFGLTLSKIGENVTLSFACPSAYEAIRLNDSVADAIRRSNGVTRMAFLPSAGPMLVLSIVTRVPAAMIARSPGRALARLVPILAQMLLGVLLGVCCAGHILASPGFAGFGVAAIEAGIFLFALLAAGRARKGGVASELAGALTDSMLLATSIVSGVLGFGLAVHGW